jgi:hypothetical protein
MFNNDIQPREVAIDSITKKPVKNKIPNPTSILDKAIGKSIIGISPIIAVMAYKNA